MSDVFHEVDEQLRADKARSLLIKAAPWAISIAVAAVAATGIYWGWTVYQNKASARASEAYANGVKAWNAGDDAAAKKDFDIAASAGSRGFKALALLQEGQMAATNGRPPAEAAQYYDKAAAAATSPLLADMARLQAVYVLIDTSPYKDIEARLTPLASDNRPYHSEAKEALAFAKILNGDFAGARTTFNALTLSADAADGVKQRAQAAVLIIDSGAAKSIPAVVKAQLAMPPQPRIPQDVLDQIQQQQQQAQQAQQNGGMDPAAMAAAMAQAGGGAPPSGQ